MKLPKSYPHWNAAAEVAIIQFYLNIYFTDNIL